MYQVSNAFLEAMKSPVQEHRLTGTIGSVSFSEANIVDGSFSISNQSTDTSDVVLGSCYVGQLTAEFTGINIEWGKWINKTITPTFSLNIGNNTWEDVPLGIFKVKEAKHTDHGVQVTAYDNMIKFDRKFKKSHFMNLAGMYNIITQLCTDAGVTLGMTQAQIEALPNGDRTGINIYGSTGKKAEFANDISTLRDLLFWVAQTLGCFATINRSGQLEFRAYTQNVVAEISNVHRIEGATFADYVTHYIGIYVENLDDNTEDYYGYDATALQQELAETMGEITEDQADIVDLEADKVEWARKLANHECTQAEYDAAVAQIDLQEREITKDINQLTKRVAWLQNAIAQAADDGSDMVLGANPLTMAKSKTTRDQQRREILGALNAISYTPFQASVLCGCVYDLGDVIQFSGGLYNSNTDSFGCVMSYTYAHNGGTELEGFGVDPSITVVRNKTQKSTDRASKNAINAKESYNGFGTPQEEFPSGGKDGDIYIKRATKTTVISKYPIEYDRIYVAPGSKGTGVHTSDFRQDERGYFDWLINGTAYAADYEGYRNFENGANIFKVKLNGPGQYKWSCDIKAVYNYRNNPTAWAKIGFFMSTEDVDGSGALGAMPMGHGATADYGLNIADTQNQFITYTNVATFTSEMLAASGGYVYIWFAFNGVIPISSDNWHSILMEVKNFYFEKAVEGGGYDGGTTTETEEYIDKVYTFVKDDGDETGSWVEIEYIANIKDGSWNGLELNYKRYLGLKDYVMRAWYKADPPQVARDFSQFCVRYTGKPDTGITISYHAGSGWEGKSLKVSDEGIYSIKCGGERRSGEVDYVAYKIVGLVSGTRYYFNFAANIGDSATFGEDNTKGLGVLFNTTGSISSNNWSGEPHTFNDTTLYESFYRNVKKHYYDFDFVATASTMYMIVTVADITEGVTTSLSFTEFVVSQEERKYIREFYLYDFHVNEWLKYRPFGTNDDGSAEGVTHLSELNDVALDNLQNGQVLEYDATEGKWINVTGGSGVADYPDLTNKPSINSITLLGNKTSSDLGIVITLTQAQYDALPLVDKQDTNKVYYITDAGGGGGGGSDVEVMSDLNDVQFDSLSGGQILQYDATIQKWKNANGYSLPTASANTLGGIKVGSRLSIDQNGVLSADEQTYSLPIASANTLGGIKVGNNLSIDQNGVLSATNSGGASDLDDLTDVDISSPTNGQVLKYNSTTQQWENQNEGGGGYVLPTASDSVLGGVKIGNSLAIDANGVLNIKSFGFVEFRDEGYPISWDSSTDGMTVDITLEKIVYYYDQIQHQSWYVDYRNCLLIFQAVEVTLMDGSSQYAASEEMVGVNVYEAKDHYNDSDYINVKVALHKLYDENDYYVDGVSFYLKYIYIGTPIDSRDL